MEAKKTILLVEDDDIVRDMIKGALERRYNVLETSNCSEALVNLRHTFDLALIDYYLPDGDGFDVLKRIREMRPALPVIFMTAYSTENLAIKALKKGVTDYIRKPLSFVYLLGKLSEILDGKSNREHPDSVENHEVFAMDCAKAFIDENFKEDLTRDKLAQKVHMERYRFSRTFNKYFGRSFKSHLNSVRIAKAAEILSANPELSVADIATSVGYSGISYFERVFKEFYGMSPSEYRKRRIELV